MTAADKMRDEDRRWLMAQPQFRRHLFEIFRTAGITRFTREEQQRLFHEGRRSLGLEILGWFSATSAEPNDVIALALAAEVALKGAKHDDRDHRNDHE